LLGGHAQLVVEGVVPDLLHVVPVGDNAVLNGVLEREDATLGLGLVAHVGVLLAHAHHHALVTGTSHNGGEDGAGGVVTGETGLAHSGAVVDHQGLHLLLVVLVSHCCWGWGLVVESSANVVTQTVWLLQLPKHQQSCLTSLLLQLLTDTLCTQTPHARPNQATRPHHHPTLPSHPDRPDEN